MHKGSLRLCDCPDVMTIADVCALLQISRRSYNRMVRHNGFIRPIEHLPGVRYAKSAVEAWVNRKPDIAGHRRPALVERRA